MDFLNILDIHFLLSIIVMLTIFVGFYFSASGRQKLAMLKIELSLKNQEMTIQQQNVIIAELRKMNLLLNEISGYEEVPTSGATLSDYSAEVLRTESNAIPNNNEANNQYKLYVGNIDYAATENELADHFARYGNIEFVNIPVNRYTGRARGFGFVTFNSRDAAERAMSLNGSEFRGRQIQVNFAKERESA